MRTERTLVRPPHETKLLSGFDRIRPVAWLAVFFLSAQVRAETLTVGPGTSYPTLNHALEVIDYNDGEADLVLVLPGTYDEQIVPKGNAGEDSVAFPSVSNLSPLVFRNAIISHPDALEIRGEDPDNPPVLRYEKGAGNDGTPPPHPQLEFYGLNPNDPGDVFLSAIVVAAKDVTLRNLEIRSGTTSDYTLNGMGTNWLFEGCLFTNGSGGGVLADDFFDFQNNPELNSDREPEIGLDNSYIFKDCLVDGADIGSGALIYNAFVWFHGYGEGNGAAIGSGVTVTNCVFRNWNDILFNFRSTGNTGTRGGLGPVTIEDSYFSNVGNMITLQGANEDFVLNRNVFGPATGHILRTEGRNNRGVVSKVIATNNLIAGKGSLGPPRLFWFTLDERTDPSSPFLAIVNNTFWNYGGKAIEIAGNQGGAFSIANNIFAATTGIEQGTGIDILNDMVVTDIIQNGFWRNVTGVSGNPIGCIAGNFEGDPELFSNQVNIPGLPPSESNLSDRVQMLFPTDTLYLQTGNQRSYRSVEDFSGNTDGTSLHPRFGYCGGIDVGAVSNLNEDECYGQGPGCCEFVPTQTEVCQLPQSDPTVTGTPTSSPTSTSTFTSTFTPTPISSPTPEITIPEAPTSTFAAERSDINGDGVVDSEDLIQFLIDWRGEAKK